MTENSGHDTPERFIVHADPDLEDLIPGFLEHRRDDVRSILEALDRQDYATIRQLAHRMKGVGGGYGFDPISSIALQIQQAAETLDGETIRKEAGELASYLERVVVVFDQDPNP